LLVLLVIWKTSTSDLVLRAKVSLLLIVQRVIAANATSVVPNIVAVDGLSAATTELKLLRFAEKVGPVQVHRAAACMLFFVTGHRLCLEVVTPSGA